MENQTDRVMPEGKWEFGGEVTAVFDDMLRRSIPELTSMREVVFETGKHFVRSDRCVLDLGCSRGGSLAAFADAFPEAKHIGLEVSEPMLKAAADRFEGQPDVDILSYDLRERFPTFLSTCLVLSVLSLQFIPIEHRPRIIRDVYESLDDGGAFILVEKLLLESALLEKLMTENYYELKSEKGYSKEQIERKRLSLEGVLVPLPETTNVSMLRAAGFRHVDCFWRWMQFGAFVAVKD